MPLPQWYTPTFYYKQSDLDQMDLYNKQIEDYRAQAEAYNAALEKYKADVEQYNKRVETWNAGPRTSDFGYTAPAAFTMERPADLGFTQEDLDAFQQEAQSRATRSRQARQTAYEAALDPSRFNLAGFGFAEGGEVSKDGPDPNKALYSSVEQHLAASQYIKDYYDKKYGDKPIRYVINDKGYLFEPGYRDLLKAQQTAPETISPEATAPITQAPTEPVVLPSQKTETVTTFSTQEPTYTPITATSNPLFPAPDPALIQFLKDQGVYGMYSVKDAPDPNFAPSFTQLKDLPQFLQEYMNRTRQQFADGGPVTAMSEEEAKSKLYQFMDRMAPKVVENIPVMGLTTKIPNVVTQLGEEAVKRYQTAREALKELSARAEKAREIAKDPAAGATARGAAREELEAIKAQQGPLRDQLTESMGIPPVKRAEGSPEEGERDPETVGEATERTMPAAKMYLGDILLGWGENRGMLEEDISPEQREWFINRALEAKAQREAETGEPITDLFISKWDKPTSAEQVGGFFTQDPSYENKLSAAYQLRNYLGDTNVRFLPDGSMVTRNEVYNFSPEYDQKSLVEWIKERGLHGALGKIGSMYGTREDTGKAVKRDIKWR